MVLILLEAKMLPPIRAPTWHHCKSEVAITVGEYWWEKTLCSQQHIVRYPCKNKNLLFYSQHLDIYFKSKIKNTMCYVLQQVISMFSASRSGLTSSLNIMSSNAQSLLWFLDCTRLCLELIPCQVMRLQSRCSLLPDRFHTLTMTDTQMTSCSYRWR